jgi:hypothetical protein
VLVEAPRAVVCCPLQQRTVQQRQIMWIALLAAGVFRAQMTRDDIVDYDWRIAFASEWCERRRGLTVGQGACKRCEELWDYILSILYTKLAGLNTFITPSRRHTNIDDACVIGRILYDGSPEGTAAAVGQQGALFGSLSMNTAADEDIFMRGKMKLFEIASRHADFTAFCVSASGGGLVKRARQSLQDGSGKKVDVEFKGGTYMLLAALADEKTEHNQSDGLEETLRPAVIFSYFRPLERPSCCH